MSSYNPRCFANSLCTSSASLSVSCVSWSMKNAARSSFFFLNSSSLGLFVLHARLYAFTYLLYTSRAFSARSLSGVLRLNWFIFVLFRG